MHWINNMWFIHALEYYTAMKMRQVHATKISHDVEQISQYKIIHMVWLCSYNVQKQTKLTYALKNPISGQPWEAVTRREQEGLLGCWECCVIWVLTTYAFSVCEKSPTCAYLSGFNKKLKSSACASDQLRLKKWFLSQPSSHLHPGLLRATSKWCQAQHTD